MKQLSSVAALAALLMLTAGCTTSGMEATGRPGADAEFAKHLVIYNEALASDVIIQDMNTRVTGGLLEVNVVLANLTGSDKKIQYRFSWYDDENFEVEAGAGNWTPLLLNGFAKKSMHALAPNPTVKTYKVNVREL